MKRCLPNPTGTSRRRPAWAALLTAAALALLAGCTPAPTADAVPAPPATAETAESAQSAQSTANGNATAENGAPAPTLAAALDGCLAYETGSAGGSLKAALAAADLVTYLAGGERRAGRGVQRNGALAGQSERSRARDAGRELAWGVCVCAEHL